MKANGKTEADEEINQSVYCSQRRKQTLVCLLMVLIFHSVGIVVFNEGFFLTRVELVNSSNCTQVPKLRTSTSSLNKGPDNDRWNTRDGKTNEQCWTSLIKFKRVIVVVIDALKYEFTEWKSELGLQGSPFENKLPVFRDLLKSKPFNSLLVPFYADPPTTTLQRLKGLTTGGLPTFIEFKDDFAKDMDITEDNLMDLLIRSGKNLTFMGDDTWMSLYPNQFHRAFPFPSFDVKDLHTVDNGVMNHLKPELLRDDWDLLVAHFLGVDHVGHRYGPFNPAMESKLLQMNSALEDLINEINLRDMSDTVLFVFGDHGMTDDGNHGGASDDEVSAALFVYSPKPILSQTKPTTVPRTKLTKKSETEIKLEETIALLHGEEKVIGSHPTLAQGGRRPVVQQIDLVPTLALLLGLPIPFGNLGMIIPDLFFGTEENHDAPSEGILENFRNLNEAMEVNVAQVLRYLQTYREKAGSNAGVPLELLDKLRSEAIDAFDTLMKQENLYLKSESSEQERMLLVKEHRRTYKVAREILERASAEGRKLWTQFNLPYMYIGMILVGMGTLVSAMTMSSLVNVSSLTDRKELGLVSLSILAFFFQLGALLSNSYIESECQITVFISVTFGLFFACLSMKQKKEQLHFQTGFAAILIAVCARVAGRLGPLHWDRGHEALPGDYMQAWFWIMCIVPLICIAIVSGFAFRHTTFLHLSGKQQTDPSTKICEIMFLAQAAFAVSFWTLQTFSEAFNENYCLFILFQARIVYILGIGGIIHVRSAKLGIVSALRFLLIPMMLITGPASPLVFLIMILHMLSYGYVFRKLQIDLVTQVVAWETTAILYFYATGHGCTFDKIQVASTFVGFLEYNWYRSGIMLFLNQFGIYLLFVFTLPALLLTIQPGEKVSSANEKESELRNWTRWEFALASFGFVCSSRALVTICFVAAQRRHLMVWAIFAPKYVFDGLHMIAVDVFVLLASILHSPLQVQSKSQ